MRSSFSEAVERARVQIPRMGTRPGDGWGHFLFNTTTHCRDRPDEIFVMVSTADADGWTFNKWPLPMFDHVSVSIRRSGAPFPRCPTWEEMCRVKVLFFGDDETVIQYHPPKSDYVNHHKYCLHLWKPIGVVIPLPPKGTLA